MRPGNLRWQRAGKSEYPGNEEKTVDERNYLTR
jgi:hypothetical protein